MPLQRRREAFDHPDWLFELKYDGFRALRIIQPGPPSGALGQNLGASLRSFVRS